MSENNARMMAGEKRGQKRLCQAKDTNKPARRLEHRKEGEHGI
jgi:hypothetical protein